MKKFGMLFGFLAVLFGAISCSTPTSTGEKLQKWRRGVWLSTSGAYTVWTDSHYFVVMASGDSTATNIYCGSSRVRYTDKGVARHQNLRLRKLPTTEIAIHRDYSMFANSDSVHVVEDPLDVDLGLFEPGVCNTVDGVIYDSVTEETSDYILLSSCDGDKIKLFSDGRSLYMPSGGGEAWSYRIESW